MRPNIPIALFVVAVALVATGVLFYKPNAPSGTVSNQEDTAIRFTLSDFGSKLKLVALQAPDAGQQIGTQYTGLVAPELLAQWQADTSKAVGRSVSSPWPDRIDAVEIHVNGTKAAAEANVIEVATAPGGAVEPVAVYPVSLQLEKRDGKWLITGLQKGAYSELPKRMSIVGYWECLPHKDRTGPQTMECAFGIAVDQSDGHFAVDTTLMSQYPVDFPTGTKVRVEGVVTPANQLSSIQKYDIDGIIRATSITKVQ